MCSMVFIYLGAAGALASAITNSSVLVVIVNCLNQNSSFFGFNVCLVQQGHGCRTSGSISIPCLHLARYCISRDAQLCQIAGISFFQGQQESGPVPFSRCAPTPASASA